MPKLPENYPLQATELISAFPTFFNEVLAAAMSAHYGPDTPTDPDVRFWINDATREFLMRGADGSFVAVVKDITLPGGGALGLAGGTMEGPIDAGGHPITNVGAGSGLAAARAQDLDPLVRVDGSKDFTGRQRHSLAPQTADHIVNKAYADQVAKAGGAFTSPVSHPFTPTDADHVTRKQYVDDRFDVHEGSQRVHDAPSIASAGQAAGKLMQSDGAGGAVWNQLGGRAKTRPRMFLRTGNFADPWQGIDTQIHGVPLGASWAVCQLRLQYSIVRFRISASDIAEEYDAPVSDVGDGEERFELNIQVLVKLDADGNFGFQYEGRTQGSQAELFLVGWI